MSVDYRPPLTREKLCEAIEERRIFTPDQAAEALKVTRNVIDVRACREKWERLHLGRKVWFWADDVYGPQKDLQGQTRDERGRFVPRITAR